MDVATLTYVLSAACAVIAGFGRYIWAKHDEKLKEHDGLLKEATTREASRQSEQRIIEMIAKIEAKHEKEVSELKTRQEKEIDGIKSEIHMMRMDFKENIVDVKDQVKRMEDKFIGYFEKLLK